MKKLKKPRETQENWRESHDKNNDNTEYKNNKKNNKKLYHQNNLMSE